MYIYIYIYIYIYTYIKISECENDIHRPIDTDLFVANTDDAPFMKRCRYTHFYRMITLLLLLTTV